MTVHADDLLGKVFETDNWLAPFLKGPAHVFLVYAIDGNRVDVAQLTDAVRPSDRQSVRTTLDYDVFCACLREGTVRESTVSPLRFTGGGKRA